VVVFLLFIFIFIYINKKESERSIRKDLLIKELAEWFSSKFTLYRQSFDYSTPYIFFSKHFKFNFSLPFAMLSLRLRSLASLYCYAARPLSLSLKWWGDRYAREGDLLLFYINKKER
jgi:hypothetical protein